MDRKSSAAVFSTPDIPSETATSRITPLILLTPVETPGQTFSQLQQVLHFPQSSSRKPFQQSLHLPFCPLLWLVQACRCQSLHTRAQTCARALWRSTH